MHITCFCDIQERFHPTVIEGLFQCNNEGSQWGNCYIDRKVLNFFKNGQLFYTNFKSYPLLLKSPEFMTLSVSKHAYSTPALKLLSLLLSHSLCNFNETTSPDQIHILRPSPLPNFSALAFHWPSKCKAKHLYLLHVFYIYQNYDKDVVSVYYSNYHIVLSYEISSVRKIYMSNSSWLHHIPVPSVSVMIKIKKADISVIYTRSFVL